MTCAERLFAYGTLLDDATYTRVTQCEAAPLVRATLHGWRRYDLPGVAYPGASPVPYPARIEGAFRQVHSEEEWVALDDYEGSEYTRVACTVETGLGPVSAFAYRFELDASVRVVVREGPLTFEAFTASQAMSRDRLSQSYVAQIHGVPVGALEIETHRSASGNATWLNQLYVSTTLRGLGLGRILLERVLEILKQAGTESVCALPEHREPYLLAHGFSAASVLDGGCHRRVLKRWL